MRLEKWWTPDTVFTTLIGAVMFVVLNGALFVRSGSQAGSDLVPATTLDRVRAVEAACQTLTDDEAVALASSGRC